MIIQRDKNEGKNRNDTNEDMTPANQDIKYHQQQQKPDFLSQKKSKLQDGSEDEIGKVGESKMKDKLKQYNANPVQKNA